MARVQTNGCIRMVVAGGHGSQGTKAGDDVIACALPR